MATPQLLGTRVERALDTLGRADPRWLWLAAFGFALAVVGSAGSWRSAIGLCGGKTTLTDATARYGAGSLVNTFVPARAGDALRLGLFSRLVPSEHPLWTTGGAFVALGAARAVVLGTVVLIASFAGVLPLWPLAVAGAVTVAGIVVARRKRIPAVAALRLIGWIALSVAGRVAAATAVGAALGIDQPFVAALVIIPALDVAGIVPLTPGNVGVASAAIAVAYHAQGATFNAGLGAGITFQAVETAVGVTIGLAGILWLAPHPRPARRIALASGVLGAVLGAAVLVPLI
ncbi:MAG: lysylphosphatidylglycerol synthase domain-containing protein [Gaiellaceae bacterium]